jgi:hypothetical protein
MTADQNGAQLAAPSPRSSNRCQVQRRYFLRKLFGYEGYTAIRNRNWTVLGLTGTALGVVADLAQVLDDFAVYRFWVALTVTAVSGLVIVGG